MTISRRAVFKTGVGVLATGLIGAGGVTRCGGGTLPIKIAGGPPGGIYQTFTELLATAINAAERRLTCKPEATEGSVANIRLIGKGDAHLGLAKADGALAALARQDPFESAVVPLRAIGRVYQDYLQIVVRKDRKDPALHKVADLNGRKVWIGTPESGTAMFSRRLLKITGLRIAPQSQPLKEATTALEKGDVDAMLWLGGVPTPALVELHGRVGIELLPVPEMLLPALRSRYGPIYRQVTVPSGSYGMGTATVGMANLLVCAEILADDIAAAVARVLIDRAAQLVLSQALGAQFFDSRTLIGTLGVPIHPGAANVYRHRHG